ncbi:hypothetical protein ACIRVK_13710 [Streptomyces sp. NPDC101152]|uniref:hypothetical protein n=1 Tax=Streptomyces sp. NPDC101152 TaxID=3366116 RepID=UPI0037FEF5C7
MTESHVDAAVRARIEAARRREAERRQQREELAAARTAGVARRHAAKLARQAQTTEGTPMPNSPFRSLPCPGCRAQRTVRKVGKVTVSRVAFDVVRCPQAGCELLWLALPERPGQVAA